MDSKSHNPYRLNILVIEDDPVIGPAIKDSLEQNKCHVDLCDSGETGLRVINLSHDVILLDIDLPGINGFKVADII